MRRFTDRVLGRLVPHGRAKANPVYYIEYKCVGNTRYERRCASADTSGGYICGAWTVSGTCKPIP